MDKHKIKKIILTVILSFLTLAAVSLKYHLTPSRKYMQGTLCSLDGEQINVLFDVTWVPHLFKPTELEGTIYIDDKAFQDVKFSYGDGFIDHLRAKFQSSPSYTFSSSTTWAWMDDDWLEFCLPRSSQEAKNLELVCIDLHLKNQRKTIAYFGPAETAEEADIIFHTLYPSIQTIN